MLSSRQIGERKGAIVILAALLAQNLGALAVMVLVGFVLVKTGLLDHSASKPLSTLLIYVLFPCGCIEYFEVDYSADVLQGLLVAFAAAIICQVLQIVIVNLLDKPFRLDPIERASALYSNSGNLIFPLVLATLGDQWVIFSLAYSCVGTTFMFVHAQSVISGKSLLNPAFLKSVILNPSILCIIAGLVLFLTGLRLPYVVEVAVEGLGAALAPVAMLVTGIGIAYSSPKSLFANRRIWGVTGLRLAILPLVVCFVLKAAAPMIPVAGIGNILLVTLMAVAAPSASMIVQFSVLYGKDDVYASSINVETTLACIVTMPLMVLLYTI